MWKEQEHGKIVNIFSEKNFKIIFSIQMFLLCLLFSELAHLLRQRKKGLKQRVDGAGESDITMMKKHENTRTYV